MLSSELALGTFLMSCDLPETSVHPVVSCERTGRKPYTKPQITAYGSVEDMTRAGGKSPGEARSRPKG